MKKQISLLLLIGFSLSVFCQRNYYWIKFKDKNNNSYSLNNPQQFLSQRSVDRRTIQHLHLDSTDLPLTQKYVDSISPFIDELKHRLKWANLVVVKVENVIHTETVLRTDTVFRTDTFHTTFHYTYQHHNTIASSLNRTDFDTLITYQADSVYDSVAHAGVFIIRDSFFLNDVVFRNQFDSLKQLSFIDSIGGIEFLPARALQKQSKFEDINPIDQHITYPSKYGAAYHQINMLNADLLHQMGYRGDGMVIGVMDNGFKNVNTNPAFDSARTKILSTWDYVNNEANVYNEGDHGATAFSCIGSNLPNKYIGTAPEAGFILSHTEDNGHEWVMEEYNWEAAAEAADSAGANIFSTSLGYTDFDANTGNHMYADLTGDKTVMTHAGNMAFKKGILVLNSAGNEGDKAWHYISAPADGDDVLAIGAVDSTEKVTNFSGRGPNSNGRIKPDICAQGLNSAVVNTNYSIGTSNGTSFSCPIMAGCVASLWSAFPDKSAADIRDAIMISSNHFWTPDNVHGYGIPNFYNAYLFLKTNYNSDILRFSNDVMVYPNPFTNELNVSLFNSDSVGQTHTIEIFNLLGQKVFSEDLFIRGENFGSLQVDLAKSFRAGEYILRVDRDKNRTQRIIKVK